MTDPNPPITSIPTDEQLTVGVEAKRAWLMPMSDERGLVRAIYLAMQAKAPATSVGGVGPHDIDRIIDALTEIGAVDRRTDPVPLINEAFRQALSSIGATEDEEAHRYTDDEYRYLSEQEPPTP